MGEDVHRCPRHVPALFFLVAAVVLTTVGAMPTAMAEDDTTDSEHDDASPEEGDAPKKAAPPPMPAMIDICMTSAVIAPTKADGSPWDPGSPKASAERVKETHDRFNFLAMLARKNPAVIATQLGLIVSGPLFQAVTKPDVFGTLELAPTGSWGGKLGRMLKLASKKRPVREFHPNFGTSTCFKAVPWHNELRLRVDLTDDDLAFDDKIATVVVPSADVARAFEFGKIMHVFVGDQDTLQLKFVALEVTRTADE